MKCTMRTGHFEIPPSLASSIPVDSLGPRAEFSRLMHDLVHRGVEAGHGDDQLTALVKVLGEP